MSFCPFMSNPQNINDNDKLYPCINSCELYTGKECSFKTLARIKFEELKNFNQNNS